MSTSDGAVAVVHRRFDPWLRGAEFGLVVFLWPVLRLVKQLEGQEQTLTLGLVAGAVVTTVAVTWIATRVRTGALVALLPLACGIAPLAFAGRWTALWSVAVASVACAGILRVQVHPRLVSRVGLNRVLLPIAVVSAVTGRAVQVGVPWIGLAAIGAVGLAGLFAPAVVLTLDRWIDAAWRGLWRFARGLGVAVRAIGLWVLAVVVVLVPWAAQRLVGWDPLARRRSSSRWLAHDPSEAVASELRWAREPSASRSALRTGHGALAGLTTVALLVGLVYGLPSALERALGDGRPDPTPGAPPTLNELYAQPWFDDLNGAIDEVISGARLSQYVGAELADTRSELVNVRDGRRRSWRPPGKRCAMVKVWMFGGSALFGVSERDDHTVPSELAKAAAADGVLLDVENWGVPGDVSWQELRRLERALADEPPPDLVIFYDGFNDLNTVADMSAAEWVRPGQFVGPLDRIHMRALTEMSQTIARNQEDRDLTVHLDPLVAPRRGAGAPTAIAQFRNTDDLTRRVLGTYDIPFVHAIQPFLDLRATRRPGEPPRDGASMARARRFLAAAPKGTVDLTKVFDRRSDPYFIDSVHVLEAADGLIARELWSRIDRRVQRIAATKDPACS